MTVETLVISLIAGAAAGVGTGFAGLSAATIISPMLISFLGYPWYESVGIGLASDVLASAFSAFIYRKNKNVDVKNGILMVIPVLVMTVVGSYFSQYMPNRGMSWFSILISTIMGLRFILRPVSPRTIPFLNREGRTRSIAAIISGAIIGFYCGFLGVGGGMMMLFILTCILGYELKTAVGTSVFVMTFTALTGAVSHAYFGDMVDYIPALLVCIAATTLGAIITSRVANKMKNKKTSRVTGVILLVLGVLMILRISTSS